MLIFHIALPDEWEHYKTRPSYQPESLRTEGFIHCSYDNQLESVIERYFRGKGKVYVITLDTNKILAKLVEEPSTNNEIFPHIYGRLNHSAVVKIEERIV